jgi:hypothetical protein
MSQAGLVGPMVAQGPVDRYRPMGVFGRPAFESHVQLRAALLSRLGPRFANYFARPTFDAERRSIRWTAESPGTVIAWSTLDADRRAQLEPTLAQIRSGLQRYVDELKAIAANPARGDAGHALASLIEQAVKVPDESHLHLVGEQPVLSFWGFENQGGHSVDAALLSAAQRIAPAAAAPAPAAEAIAVAAPVVQEIAKKTRRRGMVAWWGWLLGLLLLILLALLLAWLSRCAAPLAGWFAQSGWPASEWPQWAQCPPPDTPAKVEAKPDPEPPIRKPPPAEPVDPKRLVIPDDALRAGDLSFLAGKWDLGPRMEEVTPDGTRLGKSVDTLRFDAKGRGVYESSRENGFGPCRGPARAWIEDGKLRIETETCVGRQRSMVGKSLTCERLPDGATQCSGRNTGAAFKGSVAERFRAWLSKKE